jgi:thiol-disulfide isomerase/thioredoxin
MKPRIAVLTAAAFALTVSSASGVRADDVPPVVAAAEGVAFEPGTPAFADVLAKSKETGKPVFIDFTTDWCGWCKKLDKDTYSQASVADAMKAFVNVRVDAEKGEGVEIAKRYGVNSYPTLVIVDATGEEIDRISGYAPPAPFLKEIARIQSGEGTLAALKKSYAAKPDDLDAGIVLAGKLAASKPAESEEMFKGLGERAAAAKDRPAQAKVILEQAVLTLYSGKHLKQADVDQIASDAERLVKDYADTPAAAHAASRLGGSVAFFGEKRALAFLDVVRGIATDPKELVVVESLTVAAHKRAIAGALKRQGDAAGDDPQALNEAAWNCFEMKMNVKQALGWAQTAVEKSNRDPAVLDTLANLLWISGKHAEAIKAEEEAAGKAEGAMKKEFLANVAKWNAEKKIKGEGKKEGDEDGEEDDGDD